jgi:2-furoyl-CoA dehydrogenase large subunit
MNERPKFKFISADRRVREDRRFVAGQGRYVGDIDEAGLLHVAIVHAPHTAARIISFDASRALAMPGVVAVVEGDELAANVEPLMNGLDTPKVQRYPLAVQQVRYNGEWVAAVVAATRAQAEDAAECVDVEYEPLAHVIDAEEAYTPGSPPVHATHGSNVLLDRIFNWGEVDDDFARSQHQLSLRVVWGRSSTVPLETFGVVAMWDPWAETLDVRASIQMPKYADQIARAMRLPGNAVRVHYDIDVGGSYGVKRGIKHTVLASYLTMKLKRPVRLIEDRLENMASGDAHGPDRIFDIDVAFDADGHRAFDEDARARQRRRLCGPRPVPARQAHRRHRRPLHHQQRPLSRHFRHQQQGCAGGRSRVRPVAHQLRHRGDDGPRGGISRPRPRRHPPPQFHPARSSFPISSRPARATTAATIMPSLTR